MTDYEIRTIEANTRELQRLNDRAQMTVTYQGESRELTWGEIALLGAVLVLGWVMFG